MNKKIEVIIDDNKKHIASKKEIEASYSQGFERFKDKENINPSGAISQIESLMIIQKNTCPPIKTTWIL